MGNAAFAAMRAPEASGVKSPSNTMGGKGAQPRPGMPSAGMGGKGAPSSMGPGMPSAGMGGKGAPSSMGPGGVKTPGMGPRPQGMQEPGRGTMPPQQMSRLAQQTGRGPDSMLIHMSPQEVGGLQALAKAAGGSLTINPQTGLPEAGFLSKLLPTLIGGGLSLLSGGTLTPLMAAGLTGAGYGIAKGDLGEGLMAGLGAFGGASAAGALSSLGQGAGAGAINLTGPGTGASFASTPGATASLAQPGMVNLAGAAAPDAAASMLQPGAINLANAGAPAVQAGFSQAPVNMANMGNGLEQLGGVQGWKDVPSAWSAANPGWRGKAGLLGLAAPFMTTNTKYKKKGKDGEDGYDWNYEGPYKPPTRTLQMPPEDFDGSYEWQYFDTVNPVGYQKAAAGGVMGGLNALAAGGQPRMLAGGGDGTSDSIPGYVEGSNAPVKVADGEFVVPARTVSEIGNGSSQAGARKLYAMLNAVEQRAKSATRGKPSGADAAAAQAIGV